MIELNITHSPEIIKTTHLDEKSKIQVLVLWNNEYPEKLSFAGLVDFDIYLQDLIDVNHYLLQVDKDKILGWALTFEREGEKWFAIILSEQMKGKGWGGKMLDEIKKREAILNGWVIDHDNDRKSNGQEYISPLNFYRKNGFDILSDVRLETDKISAVKITWKQDRIT